jgi:hypothetical protein
MPKRHAFYLILQLLLCTSAFAQSPNVTATATETTKLEDAANGTAITPRPPVLCISRITGSIVSGLLIGEGFDRGGRQLAGFGKRRGHPKSPRGSQSGL